MLRYLLFFYLSGTTLAGFLDLGELNDVQYSIQILDSPVGMAQDGVTDGYAAPGGAVTMVNKFGQKYHCEFPPQKEDYSESESGSSEAPVDVSSLLQPLNNGPCIFRTKDWWTYEVCFGRKISQYHMENDRPVGAIIQLGTYNNEKEEDKKDLTYHPQWYTNGTRCDLTGRPRQTELRFVCNEAAVTEFIGDIFEPQSCEYTMVVFTDKICSVQHLRPPRESAPLDITCRPLLTADQLAEYEKYSRLKAKKAEIKLKQMKQKQKQIDEMLAGKGGKDIFSFFTTGLGDKIISELGAMMGSAVPGQASMKVVDIDSSQLLQGIEESAAQVGTVSPSSTPESSGGMSKTAPGEEGWNLVHKPETDGEVSRALKEERSKLVRKIEDSRRLVRRFTSQLHDTQTFIKESLEQDPPSDPRILETLELQKQQLEMLIAKTRQED